MRSSQFAVVWFSSTSAVVTIAVGCGTLPRRMIESNPEPSLWPCFAISTLCLTIVSATLAKADRFAQREKQPQLRQTILISLAAGTGFLSAQSAALVELLRTIEPTGDAIGPRTFVFVVTTLHACHVVAATAWLTAVTLRSFAGRYDHEHRFGLTACGWCWHTLAAAWVAIFCAIVLLL